MSFPSGRPAIIAVAPVPGLHASGAPIVTVEITNLTSEPTEVITCGLNLGDDSGVEQHALPAAVQPTLGAWAQSADSETAFSTSVSAHARWRELGWNPPAGR